MSVIDHALAVAFGTIIVVVLMQVVWRYVFNNSLTWTEELSRYLYAWIIFVGAALAIRDNSHVRVDFFMARLPAGVQRVVDFVTGVMILAFLGLVVVVGFQWVFEVRGTRSPAMSLPVNWVLYGALPVGALIGVGYLVVRVWQLLRKER